MTEDNTLPVKREQTSLARVSSQIAITNKILSGRTIVITDSMYSMYRLILDEIDRINKKVKIIYFKNVTNAFNFITSNKVHMVISGNFFPQLYGITFLIAFKSLYPQVPFILNSTIELDDVYHKNKADAFILPSSDLTDLFIAINNLIDDNKSTEKINQKIKIKDIDTMVLLDKANDILSKNTFVIKYNEFSSNALGLIYLDSGMFKKSIEIFSKAIELSEYVTPEYHYCLGVAYSKLGLYDETIEEFNKAKKGYHKYRAAYFHLSIIYLIIGQREKAMDEYNNLKNIDPIIAEELLNIITGNTKIETLDPYEYLSEYRGSDMLISGHKLK